MKHDGEIMEIVAAYPRSTRRRSHVKAAWRTGTSACTGPWITKPAMWLQYDFADGPRISGVNTILFRRRFYPALLVAPGRQTKYDDRKLEYQLLVPRPIPARIFVELPRLQ
jgi:hypothetical protein